MEIRIRSKEDAFYTGEVNLFLFKVAEYLYHRVLRQFISKLMLASFLFNKPNLKSCLIGDWVLAASEALNVRGIRILVLLAWFI